MEHITSTIDDLFSLFGTKLNITTITPASLKKHFEFKNPGVTVPEELLLQQKCLIDDIKLINEHIININEDRGTNTINLARQFTGKSLKKNSGWKRVYKFTDKDLTDGIHINDSMKETWAKLIAKYIESRYNERSTH